MATMGIRRSSSSVVLSVRWGFRGRESNCGTLTVYLMALQLQPPWIVNAVLANGIWEVLVKQRSGMQSCECHYGAKKHDVRGLMTRVN